MKQKVLIVAAHPDDEILGVGGTLARHVDEGCDVHVLFLGDGVTSRQEVNSKDIESRRQCARNALQVIGASLVGFGAFPDNRFDSVPLLDIIQFIEKNVNGLDPALVYTHHAGDLNIDHRRACEATLTAFRPMPGACCCEIRAFEVNSSTEWSSAKVSIPFTPDTYVDISNQLSRLKEAYLCYEEEQRPDPHSRSIESLELNALRRGREVGLMAAEAFMTLRRIVI